LGKKRTASAWGLVRPGAHRIELSDEGGGLFLYDEASAAAIAKDLPSSPGSPADPAHARLARAGQLVTIRLAGDGMASLELAAGAPLNQTELTSLPFLEAQEALLDLPSGELHVETPSTIPIPRRDPDADPGFVAQVTPGRYRLRLHRLDTRALERERDRRGESGRYDGPLSFVTLTPIAGQEEVPTPPVIPWIEPSDDSGPKKKRGKRA
jgi:hypothetical protein